MKLLMIAPAACAVALATATTSLIDTVTYNGRVTSAAGFTAGTYSMAITVTCRQ